jgi:predicted HD phosphohydrolase
MSPQETQAFERAAHCRDAVRVRRWDDQGKVAGLETVPLEAYLPMLRALARGG